MTEITPDTRSQSSSERVRSYLRQHGLDAEIIEFDQSTKTAALAAEAVGCQLGQIVKSLVFMVDGTARLVLVAGDRRGDTGAIATVCGATDVRIAKPDEVRDATGYAIGGVSPFDLPAGLRVLVDESLGRFDVVYTAAGTPSSVVPVGLEALVELCGGTRATVAG